MASTVLLVINLLIVSINCIEFVQNEDTNVDSSLKTELEPNLGLIKPTKLRLAAAIKSRSGGSKHKQIDLKQYYPFYLHIEDLESTLRNILYYQVPSKSEIKDNDLMVLDGFLEACVIFFPPPSNRARVLAQYVRDSLKSKKTWTGNDVKYMVINKDIQDPLFENKWITCKDEINKIECGMWVLFHTFYTQAYAADRGIAQIYRHRATNFVINYIKLYNPKLVPNMEIEQIMLPQDPQGNILWLWKLESKARERKFPNPSICEECYNPDGSVNDKKLFSFIMELYRKVSLPDGQVYHLYGNGPWAK